MVTITMTISTIIRFFCKASRKPETTPCWAARVVAVTTSMTKAEPTSKPPNSPLLGSVASMKVGGSDVVCGYPSGAAGSVEMLLMALSPSPLLSPLSLSPLLSPLPKPLPSPLPKPLLIVLPSRSRMRSQYVWHATVPWMPFAFRMAPKPE